MKCSKLITDLFSLHAVDPPEYIFRNDVEDYYLFLFECTLYYVQRQETTKKLNNINVEYIKIEALLFGCSDYNFKINQCILKTVHNFILATDRF